MWVPQMTPLATASVLSMLSYAWITPIMVRNLSLCHIDLLTFGRLYPLPCIVDTGLPTYPTGHRLVEAGRASPKRTS